MDKRTENVDHFFEELRRTPAMSVEELEEIVARREPSQRKRPLVIWGGMALVTLLVGAGVLVLEGDDKSSGSPSVSKVAMTTVRTEAPAVRHAPAKAAPEAASVTSATPIAAIQAPVRKRIDRTVMHRLPRRRQDPIIPAMQIDRAIPPADTTDGQMQSIAFTGSKLIELTPEELAAIGVRVTSDGRVEYFQKNKRGGRDVGYRNLLGDTAGNSAKRNAWVWSTDSSIREAVHYWITDSIVNQNMSEPIDQSIVVQYPSFSPAHVTDIRGKRFPELMRFDLQVNYTMTPEQVLAANKVSRAIDSLNSKTFDDPLYMSRLIPIRVRGRGGEVILWYFPHPEVLGALPRRVQLQLRDEVESIEAGIPSSDTALANYRKWISCTHYQLDSILSANRTTARSDMENPAATGSCYLSFCTITSGGINSAPIFPNPAHDALTVGYRLMGRRIVTITLHDINGAQVRELVAPHLKEAGRWEMRGSIVGVMPGIYLVVISTEKGEQVVQRVIVE